MSDFLNLLEEQVENFYESLYDFCNKGNNIKEMALIPFEEKKIRTNYKGKKELELIIKRIEKIQNEINNILHCK